MMTKDREASFDTEVLKPEDFWLFSLDLYGLPGVKDICIHIQDAHGADINLLLLCCWLDKKGTAVHGTLFDKLLQVSAHWQQNTLQPIRQRRRATTKKTSPYDRLLSKELQYEKQEQKALLELINSSSQERTLAAINGNQNLLQYGKALQLPETTIDKLIQLASSQIPTC